MKSTNNKIIGLIQANDEWPLLAMSISHALQNHADEVFVLNHACTDLSYNGTIRLNELFENRIHIVNCYDETFLQEASTNALIHISQSYCPEWIWVFDADEFLLTQENISLKKILNEVDQKYSAIRYEVQNWVSTEEFDETNIYHYKTLRHRSVPNLFTDLSPDTYMDEILNGNLNFYDIPFPSKIIFRNKSEFWLTAGSHLLKSSIEYNTFNIESDKLAVAHLPFLTKSRLKQKAKQGELLIKAGFSPSHGWQSQMIYTFLKNDMLDTFWSNHSISANKQPTNRILPSTVIDEKFANSIEPTIAFLEKGFNSKIIPKQNEQNMQNIQSLKKIDSNIQFRTFVYFARKCQLFIDLICQKRDAALTAALAERDAALAERDAALAERDAALKFLITIKNTTSWKITRPFRFLARLMKYGFKYEDRQYLIQMIKYIYHQLPNQIKKYTLFYRK